MKGIAMKIISLFFLCLLFLSLAALAAEEEEAEAQPKETLSPADLPARPPLAEVGEWCMYRLPNGDRLRMTVTEKWERSGDTELTITNEQIPSKRGKRARTTVQRIWVKDWVKDHRDLGSEDQLTRGEVLVRNHSKVPVVVLTQFENGRPVRESFFSDKIPVYGLVRGLNVSGKNKTNAMILIDYGFSEE